MNHSARNIFCRLVDLVWQTALLLLLLLLSSIRFCFIYSIFKPLNAVSSHDSPLCFWFIVHKKKTNKRNRDTTQLPVDCRWKCKLEHEHIWFMMISLLHRAAKWLLWLCTSLIQFIFDVHAFVPFSASTAIEYWFHWFTDLFKCSHSVDLCLIWLPMNLVGTTEPLFSPKETFQSSPHFCSL